MGHFQCSLSLLAESYHSYYQAPQCSIQKDQGTAMSVKAKGQCVIVRNRESCEWVMAYAEGNSVQCESRAPCPFEQVYHTKSYRGFAITVPFFEGIEHARNGGVQRVIHIELDVVFFVCSRDGEVATILAQVVNLCFSILLVFNTYSYWRSPGT